MFGLIFAVAMLFGFQEKNVPQKPLTPPTIQEIVRWPVGPVQPGTTVIFVLHANNCDNITYQVRIAGGSDVSNVTYVCRDGIIVLIFKVPPQTVSDVDIQVFVNGGSTNGNYSGTIHSHQG